jgi:hypothetical protein
LIIFIHKNNQSTNGGASPTALLRLSDAFAAQWAHAEEQTRILQAENAQLREQLCAQGCQMAAISARCEQLARHFGLP